MSEPLRNNLRDSLKRVSNEALNTFAEKSKSEFYASMTPEYGARYLSNMGHVLAEFHRRGKIDEQLRVSLQYIRDRYPQLFLVRVIK